MKFKQRPRQAIVVALTMLLLAGCGAPVVAPTPGAPTAAATATSFPPTATSIPPTATSVPPTLTPAPVPTATPTVADFDETGVEGLSDEQVATLSSLEQVDDYPLYVMRYYGAYEPSAATLPSDRITPPAGWSCSLFAALGDEAGMLYGRNFDWNYSPAVLLFTDPPNAYASVSMVDIAYLVGSTKVNVLADLPLDERGPLLSAPFLPFDGMNEHGLAIGMAAVPWCSMPNDPDRETVDSLLIMRAILDHARDIDEALAIMDSYNIEMIGGPSLHYLIADATGRSVLVEFHQRETILYPNEAPWHLATNFLLTTAGETLRGNCRRYDTIDERLSQTEGQIAAEEAVDLLEDVSDTNTQWSVVYGISSGEVHVAMGRAYDNVHTFELKAENQ
jgi:hypothetical protein